jgi:hypothetical protein
VNSIGLTLSSLHRQHGEAEAEHSPEDAIFYQKYLLHHSPIKAEELPEFSEYFHHVQRQQQYGQRSK